MKKQNVLSAALFCAFLLIMAAGYLLPKSNFSKMEKRYLAEAPVWSLKNVFSGDWSHQANDYLSDHALGRNLYVGISAYVDLLSGRQHLKDIWREEGKLLEAPVEYDGEVAAKRLKAIHSFAEKLEGQVQLMLIPSAGWAAGVEGYQDDQALQAIYGALGPSVTAVSVEDIFRNQPNLFYNTDHHWTSEGAYLGYSAYMRSQGITPKAAEDFQIETIADFHGSTYARSGLWLTPTETLELWHTDSPVTVTLDGKEIHEGVFFRDNLHSADMYTVFLNGNQPLVRISNPNGSGKCIIVRDSYSNCMGGFLAESFAEVILVDLRYYRESVSQLAAQEGIDTVLVCYSLANFLTDTNLAWLR